MLEQYFVKPATIDRLHGSWIAPQIEQYVTWLVERGYSDRFVRTRFPIAFAFGEFARAREARVVGDCRAMTTPSSLNGSPGTRPARVRPTGR